MGWLIVALLFALISSGCEGSQPTSVAAAHFMTGVVTDRATGGAISVATVRAWSCPTAQATCTPSATATTDTQGNYRIEPRGANPFVVAAEAQGYLRTFWGSDDSATERTAARITITANRNGMNIALRRN